MVSHASYSSEGEDMILRKLFFGQKKGFYIDIGAFHPKKSSNTYYFYKKGWQGINIDAMPGSMNNFNKHRKRDINLEIPLGKDGEILNFYVFQDQALNGFENDRLKNKDQSKSQNIVLQVIPLKTASLNRILEQYLPEDQEIDFIDIDVEGGELNILEQFDFQRYRPKVILLEILNTKLEDVINTYLYKLLKTNKYYLKIKTLNTYIFVRDISQNNINNNLEFKF